MTWQDLGKEFQKLRTEFRGSLPAKLRRLRSLWERIDCEEPDPDALEILERELHTMAGSAGSFGLPQVSKVAAVAGEALGGLKAGSRPGAKRAAKFVALLDKLDKA
ncbi:MAG TPA: Hpt domain-containing protein [Burkholderiales bacterium]|nr:Hpt domain-containing protein [Burkholderiales bacterium]